MSPVRYAARVIAILLVALASPASAAEPLTLKDAVAQALRQNPALAASVSDVLIAKARLVEARGAEDFVLGAAAHGSSSRGLGGPDLAADDALVAVSLARPLPTGGSLSLQLGAGYARSEAVPGGRVQPSVTLTFAHPLLHGFGTGVARAGRRRAENALDQAWLERQAAATDLVRAVVQSYWELAFATTQLRVRQSSLDLAREQLRAVQANIDVGKLPPSAAAEVEVTIALREDERLQAEFSARERSLALQQLLAVEGDGNGALVLAGDSLEPQFVARDLRTAIESAKLHHPLLEVARAEAEAASIEVEVTDNGLLPQLDLSVTGGPIGDAPAAREALTQLATFRGYQVQAGLTFALPVERNTALGRSAAARQGLHKARLSEQGLSLQITAAVTRATHLLTSAQRRIEVLARATELATLDLEAERARFQVGRSSNFDVLRRQEELARAQLQQARAKADHLEGSALLDALTAELLPRYAVELP